MLGAVIGTLGAAALSSAGQYYTNMLNAKTQMGINNANASMQYAINADQIEAARMNNETAIEMANTAHQREVRDLIDAGLNPILSANGSGASVPSLDTPGLNAPTAQGYQFSNPLDRLSSAVVQAVDAADRHDTAAVQRDNISAQADFVREQASQLVQNSASEREARAVAAEAAKVNMALRRREFDAQPSIQELKLRAREENSSAVSRSRAEAAGYELQKEKADLERRIIRDSRYHQVPGTGVSVGKGKPGDFLIQDFDKLYREGLESDMKLRASGYLRGNVETGSHIINSAGSLFSHGKK